jgi:hypothetical protein
MKENLISLFISWISETSDSSILIRCLNFGRVIHKNKKFGITVEYDSTSSKPELTYSIYKIAFIDEKTIISDNKISITREEYDSCLDKLDKKIDKIKNDELSKIFKDFPIF